MTKLYLTFGALLTALLFSVSPAHAKDQALTDDIVKKVVAVAEEGERTRRVARVLGTQVARLDDRPDYLQVSVLLRTIADGLKRCGRYACGEGDVKSLLRFIDKLYAVVKASPDPEIRAFVDVAIRLETYVRLSANMSN